MKFAHPEFLTLLVLPVLLAAWTLWKRTPAIAAPVSSGSLRRQPFTSLFVKFGYLIPALLLACAIFLLARPFADKQVLGRRPVKATNIEVLLSASRSMLAKAEIGHHCRYCASKVAIRDFVKQRTGNTMGISIFGGRPLSLVPLTADLNCVIQSIDRTFPDYIAYKIANGKDIAGALTQSIQKLASNATDKSEQILILVTDGENRELQLQETDLIDLMRKNRITLYVAMIADGGRSPVMARLAESTPGGRLFECSDAMGFFEVMRHIDRMNKIAYQDPKPGRVDDNWSLLLVLTALVTAYALFHATPFRPTPW